MRTGEVADAAGVNVQTLRYYERRGLLAAPERSLGGHRVYQPDAVVTLRVIKAAQRLGFTLDEVAELLRRRPRDSGLQDRARAKIAEIEARIADLRTVQDALRTAVAVGCADLATCAETPDCPLSLS